jgi:hypothetical protein
MSLNLTQASHEWATRPADQRFTSLTALNAFTSMSRRHSVTKVVANRALEFAPDAHDKQHKGIQVSSWPNGVPHAMTHHSFGQLSYLAGAPASYMRTLPAEIVADCLNFGMKFNRKVDDIGVLLTRMPNESGFIRRTARTTAASGTPT